MNMNKSECYLPYHEALKIRLSKMTNKEWLAEYIASPLSGEAPKKTKGKSE
jgi:hypothetical protein